jgi:dihydrofolate synthase/folylpolyglutamate synthase
VNYADAVAWIFGFTDYEFTPLDAAPSEALELGRLRALLDRLGNPQCQARTVHITGSKGKGSTASMVAALLRGSGARTGLYTSPHLHTPRERIGIDGVPISETQLVAIVTALKPVVDAQNATRPGSPLTTFELLTALAFLAFRENQCEWQVVEVGMGGRLDATNVLDEKDLCIFTPISLEHTAILGSTTAEIAADKSGILRHGTRASLAPQDREAELVVRQACGNLSVSWESVEHDCDWTSLRRDLDGQDCVVRTPRDEYRFFLPLLGGHQAENAATAILAIENLRQAGVSVSAEQTAAALASVRWPARLEVVSRSPLILVDGAHNGASASRLAEALRDLAQNRGPAAAADRRITLIIGTLADKDLPGIVQALAPIGGYVYAVEPAHPRARPAIAVAEAFAAAGVPATTAGCVSDGVHRAVADAGPDSTICVAGSLYVAAEARATLLDVPPGCGGSG